MYKSTDGEFYNTPNNIEPQNQSAGAKSKLGKSSLFVIAAVMFASKANAQSQSPTDALVAIDGIEGVAEVKQQSDGTVDVTLESGEVINLAASDVVIENGQVLVTESALDAAGLSGSTAGFGGFTTTQLAIAGGVAASAIGLGVGLSGGGGGDDDAAAPPPAPTPTPPPPPPPSNAAPVFSSADSVDFAENSTANVITATANDADGDSVTFSISGGADADLFEINNTTGELSFSNSPDFENAGDADGNNVFDVIIQASDGTDTTDQNLSVTVTNLNDNAPVITSDSDVSVAEGATETGFVATATDLDGDTLTFSITGGADADLFVIDSATGELSFVDAPDFENPADADGDNVFDVIVTASDGTNTVDQTIALTVTDNLEATSIFIGQSGSSFTSSANFQDGTLPDANDTVLIDLSPTDEVILGSTEVGTLISNADLVLNSTFTASEINLGEGAEIILSGGSLVSATVNGNLTVDPLSGLTAGTHNDTTINGDLDFTNVSGNGGHTLNFTNGLELNGVLNLTPAADGTGDVTTAFVQSAGQIVSGTGSIVLNDTRADHTVAETVTLFVSGPGSGNIVTFGEDITISGSGLIDANISDTIAILGEVIATNGNFLELRDIDNAGNDLNLNASDGQIGLDDDISNANIVGEGVIDLFSGTILTNVGFDIDAQLDGAHGVVNVDVFEGLTLNSTFEFIDTSASNFNNLEFFGEQTVDGTGEFLLTRDPDAADGDPADNSIQFSGTDNTAVELLTFGEDITIRGDGSVGAGTINVSSPDNVQILGTVAGVEGGILNIFSLDNQGAALTVEQSEGIVSLDSTIRNTIFNGDGLIDFANGGATIDNVVFNTDVRVGELGTSTDTVTLVSEELTINADFTLLGSTTSGSALQVFTVEGSDGLSVINGTGQIILDDTVNQSNNILGFNDAQIFFQGLSGTSDTIETLQIGEDIEIEGSGLITANGNFANGDNIQILGTLRGVEDGSLIVQNLNNQGETVTVDASLGNVTASNLTENTVFDVTDGALELVSGNFNNTTINGDAFISAGTGGINFRDGLELNGTLELTSQQIVFTPVSFVDSQDIDGTGEIILGVTSLETPFGFSAGITNFTFSTDQDDEAIITIGEGITLGGTGRVFIGEGSNIDFNGTITSDGFLSIGQSVVVDDGPTSVIDYTDATIGGDFGIIHFAATVIMDPNASFEGAATPGVDFGENTTVQVALDGSTGDNSLILLQGGDLGNAEIELLFEDDAAFTLGQTFSIVQEGSIASTAAELGGFGPDGVTFTGDFGSFTNFDLEGDLAFSVVDVFEVFDNGVSSVLVRSVELVVVTDQEAIDGGFIEAPAATAVVSSSVDGTSLAGFTEAADIFDLAETEIGSVVSQDELTTSLSSAVDTQVSTSEVQVQQNDDLSFLLTTDAVSNPVITAEDVFIDSAFVDVFDAAFIELPDALVA